MRRDLIASVVAAVAFTLIFGLAYPLIATGVSQVLFPNKSDGSQVKLDGKVVGSKLIGQSFDLRRPNDNSKKPKYAKKQVKTPNPRYFQPRPSVTTYSPDVTFFNNLGPNNKALMQQFKGYIKTYLALNRPYDPGLTAARHPGRRDHLVGLRRRPPHISGERADPGTPGREGARHPARQGQPADRPEHRRARPRGPRRARRERARAQHRPR